MLASLPPAAARDSAARLAASKDKRQREAAAELLRVLGPAMPGPGTSGPGTPDIVTPGAAGGNPEDLRVAYQSGRSEPARPRRLARGPRPDQRSARLLREIDDIAARHRDVPVTITSWQGSQEMLFGDVRHFPAPFGPRRRDGPATDSADAGGLSGMVLGEVFRAWWDGRPGALRGPDDARDALRAHALAVSLAAGGGNPGFAPGSMVVAGLVARVTGANSGQADWWPDLLRQFTGNPPAGLSHPAVVRHVTSWLVVEQANGPVIDESLDAIEATLASVPRHVLTAVPERNPRVIQLGGNIAPADWRNRLHAHPWHALLDGLLRTRPELFTTAQVERWYRLMRWVERPAPQAEPLPVSDQLLAAAHAAGVASDDDAATAFLHPRNAAFSDLTRHWRGKQQARYPLLVPVADRVRDQVVAVEARRGDLPTPTSDVALNISSVSGVGTAARLLANLGKAPLSRGGTWYRRYSGASSRADVLSHLLRVSFPAPGERGADLRAAAAEAGVPDARLVDLALYAPQWADPVQDALGWPGLADGVLWLHAHTKDRQWSVDRELRDSWAAQAAERTPLSADDLVDGAVDVDWFRRAHAALGPERWTVLHKAARHASSGTGHRRAQLYAGAMLGTLTLAELRSRITGKRDQDAVRALGLLPLPGTDSTRGTDDGPPTTGRAPIAGRASSPGRPAPASGPTARPAAGQPRRAQRHSRPSGRGHRGPVRDPARVRAGQQGVRRAAAGERADRGPDRRGEPRPDGWLP